MTPGVLETDVMRETAQMGFGRASHLFFDLLRKRVHYTLPTVATGPLPKNFTDPNGDPIAICIKMGFEGTGCRGVSGLGLSSRGARDLVSLLVDDLTIEVDEVTSMWQSALVEAGNIVLSGICGSMSQILGTRCHFSIPTLMHGDHNWHDDLTPFAKEQGSLHATMPWSLDETPVGGQVILIVDKDTASSLRCSLEGTTEC